MHGVGDTPMTSDQLKDGKLSAYGEIESDYGPLSRIRGGAGGKSRSAGNSTCLFPSARHCQNLDADVAQISSVASSNCRIGRARLGRDESRGRVMTIAEYFAATALVAVILWGVLGLLLGET
jgi:hypothetical protein